MGATAPLWVFSIWQHFPSKRCWAGGKGATAPASPAGGRTAVPAPGQDATGLYLHLLPRLRVTFSRGISRHSQPTPRAPQSSSRGAGG